MFCRNCGRKLEDNTKFCPDCGEKVEIEKTINEEVYNNNVIAENEVINKQMPIENEIPEGQILNENITTNYDNNVNNINNFSNNNDNSDSPNNNGLKIVIAILILIIIIGGAFAVYKIAFANNSNGGNSTGTTPVNEQPTVDINNKKGELVTLNNFKFFVPEEYKFESDGKVVRIENAERTFLLSMGIANYSYNSFIISKEDGKNELINSGYMVTNTGVETHGTRQYLIYDLYSSGSTIKYVFTKLDEFNTLYAMFNVANKNYETGYTFINKLIVDSEIVSKSALNAAPFKFEINKDILK